MNNPNSLEKFRDMEIRVIMSGEVPGEPALAWRYGIEPEHAGLVKGYLRFYLELN